jgi:hypothetical protein
VSPKPAAARSLHWEAALVLLTGALFGLFYARAFVFREPRMYPLGLQGTTFITTPGGGANGYFRKEVYLPAQVKDAWVKVASTNAAFTLLLNGKTVGVIQDPQREAVGVYDLAPYVVVGKNVLALAVRSGTFGSAPKARAEGGFRDFQGHETDFSTDGTWNAYSRFVAQGNLTLPWYAPDFLPEIPGAGQGFAEVLEAPKAREARLLTFPPDLFRLPSPSFWMAPTEAGATSAVFSSRFEITGPYQGAWARVASPCGFSLALNGLPLFARPVPIPAEKQLQVPSLEIHDVSPYLRPGTNTIDVRVAGSGSAPAAALDLLVAGPLGLQTAIASGAEWQVRGAGPFWGGDAAGTAPVVHWADVPWPVVGNLPKEVEADPPPAREVARWFREGAAIALVAFICALLEWLLFGWLAKAVGTGLSFPEALRYDAVLRLPVLLLLGTLYLLRYDVRLDPAFAFTPAMLFLAYLVLVVLRLALFVALGWGARTPAAPPRRSALLEAAALAVLVLVALSGIALRLDRASRQSLDHDEAGMEGYAESVLVHGYPVRAIGPIDKPLTTYELLPYPMALSIRLFGVSDVSARLPAVIFGGLTTLLLFHVGARLWGPITGLLAAAIHAFSPFAIYWGSKAFHPQQAQFLVLLTSYLFYRALEGSPGVKSPEIYWTAASFLATYLTWEGTGLLLPVLFVCLLIEKGRDFRWLKDKNLWIACIGIALVCAVQLGRRAMYTFVYQMVGTSLATNSVGLGFLRTVYDPWSYVKFFLIPEHHIVLTIVVLLGIPLVFADRALRYFVTVLVCFLLLLTNFVLTVSVRYSFCLQPLLILSAAAVLARASLTLRNLAREAALWPLRVTAALFTLAAVPIVFLSTNNQVLQLHRLGWASSEVIPEVNPQWGGFDYRSVGRLIAQQKQPGDVVIALMPHTVQYYAGFAPDYYLQSYTDRLVFYDMKSSYMDRYTGTPVLRNARELQDLLTRYHRVWIIANPDSEFRRANDGATFAYVSQNARVVFESYQMLVYLWER